MDSGQCRTCTVLCISPTITLSSIHVMITLVAMFVFLSIANHSSKEAEAENRSSREQSKAGACKRVERNGEEQSRWKWRAERNVEEA